MTYIHTPVRKCPKLAKYHHISGNATTYLSMGSV